MLGSVKLKMLMIGPSPVLAFIPSSVGISRSARDSYRVPLFADLLESLIRVEATCSDSLLVLCKSSWMDSKKELSYSKVHLIVLVAHFLSRAE